VKFVDLTLFHSHAFDDLALKRLGVTELDIAENNLTGCLKFMIFLALKIFRYILFLQFIGHFWHLMSSIRHFQAPSGYTPHHLMSAAFHPKTHSSQINVSTFSFSLPILLPSWLTQIFHIPLIAILM
jgi:hypothetical protein